MSDDLDISGAGSTSVATEELRDAATMLGQLAMEAQSLRARLHTADGLMSLWRLQLVAAPRSAARAELDIDQAILVMHEIELSSRALKWALDTAADGYGFIEIVIRQLFQEFTGDLGGLLGRILPGLAVGAIPTGSAILGGLIGAAGLAPGGAAAMGERAQAFARQNNELLTNPFTVELVRQAAMGSDDALLSAAGLPLPLVDLLGDNALGFAGIGLTSAATVMAGRGLGLFRESDVRLGSSSSTAVDSSPSGFVDRLDRVPHPETAGGPQVVVERYSTPGEPDRFEVYVAGTVTFDPVATGEPWDMTSNMTNAIGGGSGSYESVAEAMRLAGVDADSPVQFTGYSQGGATAALLAASGDYNTQGLATFGAPAGQVRLPEGFPVVMVEHLDDIVPALGGSQVNEQAVYVQRDVFGGRDIPEQYAVPSHHYEYYAETASLMDGSDSSRLADAIGRLDAFGQGASTVTSTAYRFEREMDRAVSAPSGGR